MNCWLKTEKKNSGTKSCYGAGTKTKKTHKVLINSNFKLNISLTCPVKKPI